MFWNDLKKPIMTLAPMADVTDPPFRRIIAKYGKPDVMFTEFSSCDALLSAGKDRTLKDLVYSEEERPIVLQLFSGKPEAFKKCGKIAQNLGFDGIDINMGCPDRSIEKSGAGASLIKNKKLGREIISATKEGAGDLPVSVKTRIGYNENEIDTWIPEILKEKPAALTIHLRTRKEMSKVPAHWELAKDIVSIRDEMGVDTLLLGNGDVRDFKDGEEKTRESGMDGVMFGSAIFGNPWFFNRKVNKEDLPVGEVLGVLVEHTRSFEELMGGIKSFQVMKRHFKAYVNDFDGAKELRMRLMECDNADCVEEEINKFL